MRLLSIEPRLSFSDEIAPRVRPLDLLLLALWTSLLNLPGLGALEFFRHTEADRTLIAWEMLERGNFAIPHLLGSEILTKPPLFYWLIAAAIAFFGTTAEWVARFPSAVAATLLVIGHYLFLLFAGASRTTALLGALFLSTGSLFLTLANAAEIDMLFGTLSSLSLFLVYFAILKPQRWTLLTSYLLLALAFLTKGPPVLFFFGAALLGWGFIHRREIALFVGIARFGRWNLLGCVLFSALCCSWLWISAANVGWAELERQFQVEIFDRVFRQSTHEHGKLFYLGNLPLALLPWSVFLLLGFLLPLLEGSLSRFRSPRAYRNLLSFNVYVVIAALIALSFAEGKSARYVFPIFPFAVNLCLFGLYQLQSSAFLSWVYRLTLFVALPLALTFIGAPFVAALDGVPRPHLVLSSLLIAAALALLAWGSFRRHGVLAILSLLLLAAALRFGEKTVYAAHRNSTRSVKPIAHQVNTLVPPALPIYTVEMFERWVVYYLRRDGRQVFRLSPQVVAAARNQSGRVYILLSYEEESWRLLQLGFYDPSARLVADLRAGKDHLWLIEADPRQLSYLEPLEKIPTVPSEPFYFEAARLAAREVH